MLKSFIIARSNMRKAKGQTVAIVVLILLSAMLLNLWLMLSTDYSANFDRHHDKLNAQHVMVTVSDEDGEVSEFLDQKFSADKAVTDYSLDRCMHMTMTFPYNGEEMNSWFVFLEKDASLNRTIGRSEIVEEGKYDSGVYLPMIYKMDDIAVGKTVNLSIGSHAVKYTVCGFFNNVMTGSHNCGIAELIMTKDKYEELEKSGYAPKATLASVRLKDKTECLNYEAALESYISERFPNVTMVSNSYDMVVQARYISQMICSAIISAMAFFVLLIAVVVIVSNIVNYIHVNIKNLGVLKATGYTSRQLVCSLLLQFLGLALIAAIVGVGLSYCLFPAVNGMMIAQTGIPYAVSFLPLPVFITLLILCGTIALSVLFASRKMKKIEPIVALRSGILTHNFKRNHVPLEKTKAPLNLALALKTMLSGIKHNITVCITMLVLSFVVVFSGIMVENVIVDMTPFVDLIVGETTDSCISVRADTEDGFLNAIAADDRVEKVYLFTTLKVMHAGGAELSINVCDDFSKVNNKNVMYDGRFPKYDNEIAIGAKYAKEKNLKVGGEIEIIANGKTEKYLISGLTQLSNYLGRDGLLTRQGYGRLGSMTDVSYYINMKDGADIDAINAEIKEAFAGEVNTAMNIESTIQAAAVVYVSLMTIIVVAVLVLSAIIIAFVLYLLVRTMLNNKKRDYGILKALGFTTRQLILQTALSFMPAIILSTVVGLIIGGFTVNPLMSLILSSIGIMRCTFAVPVGFTAAVGVGLILLSFGIACLLSLKIKKITPKNLLAD